MSKLQESQTWVKRRCLAGLLLAELRQRWLELMDVWDKVDTLAKSEHYFGRSRLREAAALLRQVPVNEVASSLNSQCAKALDRLEDAHEQVVRLDAALTESWQRIQQQLAQLLSEKLTKTSEWLKSLRLGGLKFCEPDSDPSPLFPTIQHHCDECLELLNLGEAETAAEHLKQGFTLASQTQSAIQMQVDSKEVCRREIPIRTTEQRQLDSQLQALEPVLLALETEFAAASWSTVANLRSTASAAVLDGNTVLSDATLAGSDTVQYYQKATEALRRLKQLQSDTTILIASGDQRLQQLRQLRSTTTAELNRLQQERNRVASLLQSSGADRAAANRRFRDAESALQEQIQAAARSRADWPQIVESLKSVGHEFSTAEQMAREDIRLAEQAAQEIMNAQRELRQAESFFRSGYKADVTAIRPQLQAAQQALNSQEYERAIQLANTVVSVSRQELRQAQSAADATEQRRELERRDRNRSPGAGLGVMSKGISNAPAAGHSPAVSLPDNIQTISAPSAPSSSSHSQSSSSGWSSETSQSSW